MATGNYLCIIGQGDARARAKLRRVLECESWQRCGNPWTWARIPCSDDGARKLADVATAAGVRCAFVPVSDAAYSAILNT